MIDWLKTKKFHQYLLISIIIFSAVFRFTNFTTRFHFTGDQALASSRAYEIWKNKEITLVGIPITSWSYEGKNAHISSTAYYLQLIPMLLTNFDPMAASFLVSVFAVFLLIPLYIGTKKITKSVNAGLLMAVVFGLFPLYINYTVFLWNPNFQLLLAPLSIFLMGLYEDRQKPFFLCAGGAILGLMATLHFQFALGIFGIFITYTIVLHKRKKLLDLLLFVIGLIFGFSPMILAELHTQFYNSTIILSYFSDIFSGEGQKISNFPVHYGMVSLLFLILGVVTLFKKYLTNYFLLILILALMLVNATIYLPKPSSAWNLPNGWYYSNELEISKIIVENNLSNFNILNLAYVEPLANVQKYLLITTHPETAQKLSTDYYSNEYLYVFAQNITDVNSSQNYEVKLFPNEPINTWKIGDSYNLYLFQSSK